MIPSSFHIVNHSLKSRIRPYLLSLREVKRVFAGVVVENSELPRDSNGPMKLTEKRRSN